MFLCVISEYNVFFFVFLPVLASARSAASRRSQRVLQKALESGMVLFYFLPVCVCVLWHVRSQAYVILFQYRLLRARRSVYRAAIEERQVPWCHVLCGSCVYRGYHHMRNVNLCSALVLCTHRRITKGYQGAHESEKYPFSHTRVSRKLTSNRDRLLFCVCLPEEDNSMYGIESQYDFWNCTQRNQS
jgi:hypothetical protein